MTVSEGLFAAEQIADEDTTKPSGMVVAEFRVDPAFKAMIPALSNEEFDQLEKNILADGCRDPLTVWNGILLDGHNRYEICTKHNLPFKTVSVNLASREAAEDWVDANQLGRRNLTPDSFKLLLGRRYLRLKKTQGTNNQYAQAKSGDEKPQNEVFQSERDKPSSTAAVLAKEHGVSKGTVERAAKFALEVEKTPELQQAILDRKPVLQAKREIKEANREARREENRQKIAAVPAPEKIAEVQAKFATITIDPPWDWGDEGDQDQLGRARPDYSTMSFEQLMALDVGKFADDDCHLYLWITNRSLPKGFALVEKWGFRYITALTWVKPHFGMGNYFRGQTEQILFGVKGSQPLKRKDVGTAFNWPRGPNGHSSKPVEFYEMVESCSPGPYFEMFSRMDRPDWTAWGENSAAA